MLATIRKWRARRVLRSAALPDALWNDAVAALPFLAAYAEDELARLRNLTVLFLATKSIAGTHGHDVTPLQRTIIALQACVLVLNLDLALYDDFSGVVVFPDEFTPVREWEDEAGVVHRYHDPLAGEAMPGGPVLLSWRDVEASADWEEAGMNLVIHEFAHKIDMRDGDANGCPPLPPSQDAGEWRAVLSSAFADFHARVERGEDTAIDPYAAEDPGEFFAVLSEVFFAGPRLLRDEYPDVYRLFAAFYRQDPAARAERQE